MQISSLGNIQNELRPLKYRLDLVGDLVEKIILRQLPKTKIKPKEIAEFKKSISEIRSGKQIKLEELTSA
jgi:hypothetical protein